MGYSFGRVVDAPFDDTVARLRLALQAEGFGVLTEADIAATMREKLEVEIPPYLILGACNPPLAHRALAAEPEIGVLLPCNVVVREDDAGDVHVVAMDPESVLELVDNPGVAEIGREVKERLERVVEAI